MLNTFSGWLFNVLLWGGIIGISLLGYHTFVGPVLYDPIIPVVALGAGALVALFWPKL
jgi:hypothetical protein